MSASFKRCYRCGMEKTIDSFRIAKPPFPARRSECKDCGLIAKKEWSTRNSSKKLISASKRRFYARNRDKVKAAVKKYRDANKEFYRDYEYRRRYGITKEQFDSMLVAQGGVCAICAQAPNGRRMCVDHCHGLGSVRAILCRTCNTGIGAFMESESRMLKAIEYLKAYGSLKP